MQTTDNYKKHTGKNTLWQLKFFQKALIENYFNYLIGEIRTIKPQNVLDVGCGEGFTLNKLQENGIEAKLEGIDFFHTAIKIGIKMHPDLHLKQANIYDLPYKDNSFDLVLCTEVLEHLDDPEKALKELKRVTKKYCLISVPNEPWFMLGNFLRGKNLSRLGNDIEHIQHWTTKSFRKFVGKDFTIKSTRTPLPWTMVLLEK